jgi:2-methylisocitrate lyase-like PEP mutase family enzyme
MIERGLTPTLPARELAALGFRLVGYVLTGLYCAAYALREAYTELRERGTSVALEDRMVWFGDFHTIIGLPEKMDLESKYRCD